MTAVLIDVTDPGGPRVADSTLPFLHADDLGAVRGDGVFETVLVRGGRLCNGDRHRDRFLSSAAMLDLPAPDLRQWDAGIDLALRQWSEAGGGEGAMRWVYSRGRESTGVPTGYILLSPVLSRAGEVKVMLAERGFSLDLGSRAPWALIGAKTLSYAANMAALRYAKDNGFDDVIFTSAEGNLLEGPTSTLVLLRGNELVTPNPGEGVLPGTTQASLYEVAAERGYTCTTAQLRPEDLLTADSVWLVSSVRIAARVTSVDGDALREVPPEQIERFAALCDDALTA